MMVCCCLRPPLKFCLSSIGQDLATQELTQGDEIGVAANVEVLPDDLSVEVKDSKEHGKNCSVMMFSK